MLICHLYFFLFVSTVARSSGMMLRITEGSTVILPCHYSVKHHGLSQACWGRNCGAFWCNDIVIQTDENGVISKVSDRYKLIGDVLSGQMDLGIQKIQKTDSGSYCCRINIDGFFNDKKVTYSLKVMKGKICVLLLQWSVFIQWNLIWHVILQHQEQQHSQQELLLLHFTLPSQCKIRQVIKKLILLNDSVEGLIPVTGICCDTKHQIKFKQTHSLRLGMFTGALFCSDKWFWLLPQQYLVQKSCLAKCIGWQMCAAHWHTGHNFPKPCL